MSNNSKKREEKPKLTRGNNGLDRGLGIAGSDGGSGNIASFTSELDGGPCDVNIETPEPGFGSGPCGGSGGNSIVNYKLGGGFRIGILDYDDVRGSGDIVIFSPELGGGPTLGSGPGGGSSDVTIDTPEPGFRSGPGGGPRNVAVDTQEPGFGDEPDGGSSDTDSCDCEEYCEELSGEHRRWRVKSGGRGR